MIIGNIAITTMGILKTVITVNKFTITKEKDDDAGVNAIKGKCECIDHSYFHENEIKPRIGHRS